MEIKYCFLKCRILKCLLRGQDRRVSPIYPWLAPSPSYLSSHRDSHSPAHSQVATLSQCPTTGPADHLSISSDWPVSGPGSPLRRSPVQELLAPGPPEPPLAPVVRLQPVLLIRAVVAWAVSQGLQMVSVKQEVSWQDAWHAPLILWVQYDNVTCSSYALTMV